MTASSCVYKFSWKHKHSTKFLSQSYLLCLSSKMQAQLSSHSFLSFTSYSLCPSCSLKVKVIVTQSWPTPCDPWTVTLQALLSMEHSKQEYWTGLPFPSSRGSSWPRDWTRIFSIASKFFTSEPQEMPPALWVSCQMKFLHLFAFN